jgi:hypothetical protein
MRCAETSPTNHPTPRNNSRERPHRSRSLKFRIFRSCVADYDCDGGGGGGGGVLVVGGCGGVFTSATVVFISSVIMDIRIVISRAF